MDQLWIEAALIFSAAYYSPFSWSLWWVSPVMELPLVIHCYWSLLLILMVMDVVWMRPPRIILSSISLWLMFKLLPPLTLASTLSLRSFNTLPASNNAHQLTNQPLYFASHPTLWPPTPNFGKTVSTMLEELVYRSKHHSGTILQALQVDSAFLTLIPHQWYLLALQSSKRHLSNTSVLVLSKSFKMSSHLDWFLLELLVPLSYWVLYIWSSLDSAEELSCGSVFLVSSEVQLMVAGCFGRSLNLN